MKRWKVKRLPEYEELVTFDRKRILAALRKPSVKKILKRIVSGEDRQESALLARSLKEDRFLTLDEVKARIMEDSGVSESRSPASRMRRSKATAPLYKRGAQGPGSRSGGSGRRGSGRRG